MRITSPGRQPCHVALVAVGCGAEAGTYDFCEYHKDSMTGTSKSPADESGFIGHP